MGANAEKYRSLGRVGHIRGNGRYLGSLVGIGLEFESEERKRGEERAGDAPSALSSVEWYSHGQVLGVVW